MNIDLSKINKEHLDQIIKEEVLRLKAERLNESKVDPRQKKLMMEKSKLESELKALLESSGLEEGIFGSMFGGGGNKNAAARKQAVLNLLSHPNKSKVLLTYASPEQMEEFKSYLPADKQDFINWTIKKFIPKKENDPARTESYIQFFMKGGKNPAWDAAKHQYADAGSVSGNASTAFAEGEGAQE